MKNSLKLKKILASINLDNYTKDDIEELRIINNVVRKLKGKSGGLIKKIKQNVDEENIKKYSADDKFLLRFTDNDGIVKYFTSDRCGYGGSGSPDIKDASVFVGYLTAMDYRSFSYIIDIDIIPEPPNRKNND